MPAFLNSNSKIQFPIRNKINCGSTDQAQISNFDISIGDDDPALLLFTSGSTGVPKCVPLSLSNIASNIEDFSRILGISSEDCFLCTSPLWYAHGLYNSLLSALFLGATVVNNGVLNLMNAANAVRIANKHGASIYHLSPSMVQILLLFSKKLKEPFPKFKKIICGTAKLDPELKLKFENAFQTVVTQQYGMTETLFITVNAKKQILCPESVGEPVSCEIRIFDDAMKALPEGSVGEIAVKSKSSFGEYFNQPDESRLSYSNGWFFTGDLGKIDSDGYLTVTGRKKELIKKGGVNINPHEINAVLSGFDGVSDAATVSVPDKIYGEEIYSFVSGSGLKEDKLHEHCRGGLPKTHLPKRIFILDRLPKTSNGKIAIQELKKLAETSLK